MADPIALAAAVAVLAAVHVAADRLTFLDMVPRSRWLSIAGGVPVAYAFVRLLPGLPAGQAVVDRYVPPVFLLLEKHVYLLAFAGLLTLHGLELVVRVSLAGPGPNDGGGALPPGACGNWV